jgi:hypothetical protein
MAIRFISELPPSLTQAKLTKHNNFQETTILFMPLKKSKSQLAAGKLISAIQKEWGLELGTPAADVTEDVMELAHNLLLAKSSQDMQNILGSQSVRQYLGVDWVSKHPSVEANIDHLTKAIAHERF